MPARSPARNSHPHIRRTDDETRRTHGWMVTLQRRLHITNKLFSDGVWGGKRAALAAAKDWLAQQTGAPTEYQHQLWLRNRKRRNNRSGLVGVARYERNPASPTRNGAAFWLASWIDERGVSRKRKFSVHLWGEQGARQRAREERQRQLRRAVAAKTKARG